jgi:chromosome segregation ATPase
VAKAPPNDQQIKASFEKALDLAARCDAAETSDNYEFLEQQIDELEAQAREAVHAKMDFKSLLAKLVGGLPLTPADLNSLELLIVGDAEYYLRYESEIEEWKTQLKRVLDQIANLQISAFDVDTLMHIRALCREAHEVLSDLVYYFDAKERIAKFKIATQGRIDPDGYRFLAEIVQEMLASDKM